MDKSFKSAFEYKVIYVFTVEDDLHRGLVKIGDATLHTDNQIDVLSPNSRELNQAALARIKSYSNTIGLTPKLLHTELAVRTLHGKDGMPRLVAFRDHQVHEVLRNSGIPKKVLGDSREWFEIDLETAKKAIDAVKHNFANLSNTDVVKYAPIVFRPEQAECIAKVVKHFKKADRFLINAKMRYGKTFVSLEIIKRCEFEKTIILTHRPVVDDGWYDDFTKIFHGHKDYIYGSKAKGNSIDTLLSSGKKFVYFASIQDLRGSAQVGGKFEKNDVVFDTVWDCVIVDEAHEGTTTALGEDTVKAVVKEGQGTKFLALSGTPFNILSDYDEDAIYTWDYIMEQENKSEWDKLHFGDSNPYDELPELRIYTYSLGEVLRNSNYITFEDKAFNFHEFFRTWTGDFSVDYAQMPESAQIGDFVHEADVRSFLNLMTKTDEKSRYPYSSEEYRGLFKHSLWMVPGVREARALKKLMLDHPIFGNGTFDIVNVAGSGDEEEKAEEALAKVRKAIRNAGDGYTITLSCGKLTTGVTVKEWTAVFMLAGSFSTSAAQYLQTIFRVQSPCNEGGKIKETAYVFDFAPDRTLKMVSSAVSVSSKAGKTKEGDKQLMGKFLNYCPVIAVSGSEMQEYSAAKLLQQLKRAYAEKVVRNGFDDSNLYNDELFKLNDVDIQKFDDLKRIIGKSKAAPKSKDITVNDQGLTNEEYEEVERLKKKQKKQLTPEEQARLDEIKRLQKLRGDAISILRGISIRMPLLIYGADIPYDEEITLDRFVDLVDDSSWDEFMPTGVTKAKFREFQKYYDEEVFIAAGRRIRNIAREADTLEPTERVQKIAGLFNNFKNPDKETVLTPWRVVNMHMSDCLGGWDFYDDAHKEPMDKPRFVDHGAVTAAVFGKPDTHILEINSKTGLYPLYVAYSVYRAKCARLPDAELTLEKKRELWMEAVEDNVFVVCKTPMAKTITQRTLTGYTGRKINAHYFDDLINALANKPEIFLFRVTKASYWKKGGGKMEFDAVVGNPPYQKSGGSGGTNDAPIYQHFVTAAERLEPKYISLIMPSRWFSGGRENLLADFRRDMLTNPGIRKMFAYVNPRDIFPDVEIKGGLCYYLYDANHTGDCEYTLIKDGERRTSRRNLSEFDVLIREPLLANIVSKVMAENPDTVDAIISGDTPFGIPTNVFTNSRKVMNVYDSPSKGHDTLLFYLEKGNRATGYIDRGTIKKHREDIDRYKVFIPKAGGSGNDPNVLSKPEFAPKNSVCSQTYIYAAFDSEEKAQNFITYLKTRFFRILVSAVKISQDALSKTYRFVPMQDFSKPWTDAELYAKYGLTDEEIAFIETTIKPME